MARVALTSDPWRNSMNSTPRASIEIKSGFIFIVSYVKRPEYRVVRMSRYDVVVMETQSVQVEQIICGELSDKIGVVFENG